MVPRAIAPFGLGMLLWWVENLLHEPYEPLAQGVDAVIFAFHAAPLLCCLGRSDTAELCDRRHVRVTGRWPLPGRSGGAGSGVASPLVTHSCPVGTWTPTPGLGCSAPAKLPGNSGSAHQLPIARERLSLTRRREQKSGARRARTADPLLAKQALSQLSYGPCCPSIAEAPDGW